MTFVYLLDDDQDVGESGVIQSKIFGNKLGKRKYNSQKEKFILQELIGMLSEGSLQEKIGHSRTCAKPYFRDTLRQKNVKISENYLLQKCLE